MIAWPILAVEDYSEANGRERAVIEVAWSWEQSDRIWSRSWTTPWMVSR